jgi:hypothetical protein
MHSSCGWLAMILSATDFAPSYPILLLNRFKNFKDLFPLSATESYVAPGTPNLFLLKSRTSMI